MLYAPLNFDRFRPSLVLHSLSTVDRCSAIRRFCGSSHAGASNNVFNWYRADGSGSVDGSSLIFMPDKSIPWGAKKPEIRLESFSIAYSGRDAPSVGTDRPCLSALRNSSCPTAPSSRSRPRRTPSGPWRVRSTAVRDLGTNKTETGIDCAGKKGLRF